MNNPCPRPDADCPCQRLGDCREGCCVRVVRLTGEPLLRQRLMELGFTRGAALTVVRYAPLKDPIEVLVRGAHLSLRVGEANTVEVAPLEAA
ncbi:MAG: ferrous iron transport protein A [Fibrobacterota bacterium]